MASLSGLTGFPTATAYSMTKAAAVTLSVSLRSEGAAFGVKVSVVCPGHVATRISNQVIGGNASDEGKDVVRSDGRMRVEKAVNCLLAGVEKNSMVIVFPFKSRLKWWVNRLCPELLQLIGRRLARRFRKKKYSL